MRTFILSLFTLFMIAPAHAMELDQVGTKVGETIPHQLSTVDAYGNEVSFDSLKGEKGLIILFNRSVDWCSYCKKQVKEWDEAKAGFEELGYTLATITYDDPKKSNAFAMKHSVTMPILYDKDSEIIQAFNVLNTNYQIDSPFYGIPFPFIFVIDNTGKVTHRFAEESYKVRPEITQVKTALLKEVVIEE